MPDEVWAIASHRRWSAEPEPEEVSALRATINYRKEAAAVKEERPFIYRIGNIKVDLWPEERAMLTDFANLGSYPTAYTGTMQDLKALGLFSRLEECGPNGTAIPTEIGRELFKRIGAPLASVDTLPKAKTAKTGFVRSKGSAVAATGGETPKLSRGKAGDGLALDLQLIRNPIL